MYAQKLETLPPPPGVIGSLKAGFDVVAGHVFLILIPLLLDLFLWLGPRLSVSKVLGPVYSLLFEQARRGLTTPDDVQRIATIQGLFNELLQRFYLFCLIVIGWAVGGLYFRWVSETTLGQKAAGISPLRAVMQTFILSTVW